MNYDSLETKLIRQQNECIKQMEEQLEVYRKKDEAQEQLITYLQELVEILKEEICSLKAENPKEITEDN